MQKILNIYVIYGIILSNNQFERTMQMLQFLLTICDEQYHSRIEYIYNRFHDDMMRFAVSKFRTMNSRNPVLDAEDAVQRAYLRITKYIHNLQFPMHDNKLRCYVFSVVLHEVIRISEENVKDLEFREEIFVDDGYNIIDDIDIKLMYEDVVKAIENLDPVYSTTLLLKYERGLTPAQIAEMMEIPEKTVYTRLSRGKKMLRDALKGE